MKRPLRSRVWFWKPEWYWHGWRTLVPFFRGGDEFNWHTIVLGWTITGRVVIALHPCRWTGRCSDIDDLPPEMLNAAWPIDAFGHNHVQCLNPKCHCREDSVA